MAGARRQSVSGLDIEVSSLWRTVVQLRGEIDTYTALQLRDRLADLIDNGHREIVLDLAQIDFLDSTGIWTIVRAHKRLTSHGGRLVLRSVSPSLRRLLDVTGVPELVIIEDPAVDWTDGGTGRGPEAPSEDRSPAST